MTTVWIVEDDPKIRASLVYLLRDAGFVPSAYESAEGALASFDSSEEPAPDLLLADVRLPGRSGVDLVRELSSGDRLPPTVIISGEASIAEAVSSLQLGVYDFIEKPFTKERLLNSVRNALREKALRKEVAELRSELGVDSEILGRSAAIVEMQEQIARAAPTDASVLITGESGTGKELVADALRRRSSRPDGPFIKLNCAAIPPHLVEDELFGHVRGAYTDAKADRAGVFEEADGGTLFLDEIGDMDYALQSRLLRVLEDGRVRRVGETKERTVDVRLLAATHAILEEAIREGTFREDLYFRLARLPLVVPPLRDREGDVRLLFEHFVAHFSRRHRAGPRRIEPDVYPALERYSWPGNVRELRSLCERLVVMGTDPIGKDQLPGSFRSAAGSPAGHPPEVSIGLGRNDPVLPLKEFKKRSERQYLESVLERTGWNVAAAARLLGMQRTHLHQKLIALELHRPR